MNFRFRRINPWMAAVNGLPAEEHVGRSIEEVMSPENAMRFRAVEKRLRDGEDPLEMELSGVLPETGQEHTWSLTYRTVTDGVGAPAGYLGVVRDVTARRRAEADLRASEERYRLLIEQAPDGILLTNQKGRFTEANEAACSILGRTRAQLLGMELTEVMSPEHLEELPATLEAYARGEVVRKEWLLRRADGSTFPAEILGRQLPDGGLQCVVRDMTEARAAEEIVRDAAEKARESAAILDGVLRETPGVVYVKDRAGRMVRANTGTLDLIGKPWPEVELRTDVEFLDDRAQAEAGDGERPPDHGKRRRRRARGDRRRGRAGSARLPVAQGAIQERLGRGRRTDRLVSRHHRTHTRGRAAGSASRRDEPPREEPFRGGGLHRAHERAPRRDRRGGGAGDRRTAGGARPVA